MTPVLRPIRDDDDLLALALAAREPELAALGLPPSMAEPFARLQAEAQRRSYAAAWPGLRDQIVELDGEVAGRLIVDRDAERVLLIDVVVLPAYRHRGLNSWLVRHVRAEADAHGLPVEASMLMTNPHIPRFLRLGFEVVGERPPHVLVRIPARGGA
ncbi:MAG TPA: GNAT family N-acetyltransferase [Myxococcota bacterium]|nr:GNAT family N-acetyltransferase [Myxococcota bacterium]